MAVKSRVHCIIKGSVQGIGYRWFVQKTARSLGLNGWVKNLSDGDVEVDAEGDKKDIDAFLGLLETGHRWARVNKIDVTWLNNDPGDYEDFEIKF